MIGELPSGWASAPLDSLCEKLRGVSYKREEACLLQKSGCLPILRANNIDADRLIFGDLVWVPSRCVGDHQKIRAGDIVVAMSSGSKSVVGKTAQALADWKGGFGAFCGVLRPYRQLNSRYLGLFLRTREYRSQISSLAAGSNINNLRNEHFAAIDVPLAPLAEQVRIVSQLETVLAKADECQHRIERVAVFLKRLRQSVLAAAYSGRLTVDWREQNPGAIDASDLIAELELSHQSAGGHKRGNAAPPTDEAHDLSTDELPSSWCMTDLRTAVCPDRPITYGILKPGPNTTNGIPYVRVADFPNDQLNLENIRRTTRDIEKTYARARLRTGDILLSIRGTVGRVVVVPPELQNANITQDTARVSIQPALNSDFVMWYLRSTPTQKRMQRAVKGVAVRGINIGDVRALQVPVPPRGEQVEIVRRVEALLGLADRIEARYMAVKQQVDHLPQSILAKAFRGELVPTEAELAEREGRSYESADELLKRIRLSKQTTTRSSENKNSRRVTRRRSSLRHA